MIKFLGTGIRTLSNETTRRNASGGENQWLVLGIPVELNRAREVAAANPDSQPIRVLHTTEFAGRREGGAGCLHPGGTAAPAGRAGGGPSIAHATAAAAA